MFKKYLYILITFLSLMSLLFSPNTNNNLYFPIKNKKYYITSYYGYRSLGSYHFHNGIDIGLSQGTPLYALSDGVVSFIGYYGSFGNAIIIKYANGYKSLYGHISSNFILSVGDSVKAGSLVAYVGPKYLSNGKLNGFTTGPHLHFTLYYNGKQIDPLSIKYST